MRLTCMQCKKTLRTFDEDEFSTVLYSDDGIYFFCNKVCKEKWDYPVSPGATSEDHQRPSI